MDGSCSLAARGARGCKLTVGVAVVVAQVGVLEVVSVVLVGGEIWCSSHAREMDTRPSLVNGEHLVFGSRACHWEVQTSCESDSTRTADRGEPSASCTSGVGTCSVVRPSRPCCSLCSGMASARARLCRAV